MNVFKLSKRIPHEDARMTLGALHEKKLKEFQDMYKELPLKKNLLNELSEYPYDNKKKIEQLKKEIIRLENKEEETEYLLKAAPFLLEYSQALKNSNNIEDEENNKETSGMLSYVQTSKGSNKGEICKRYMQEVLHITYEDRKKKGHVDVTHCSNCNIPKIINYALEESICPECGLSEAWKDRSSCNEYMQEVEILSPFAYKRINHFKEWLAQLQAKEASSPPEHVIKALLIELKKERITDKSLITPKKIKSYLKKLRLNKQYEHIPAIIHKLCDQKPPIMTRELENKLISMFEEIQGPFEKHCPKNRKNFLSYSYTLHKMCELLEEDRFLICFPLLKSREKLYTQDTIWKGICEELNWQFIPSL